MEGLGAWCNVFGELWATKSRPEELAVGDRRAGRSDVRDDHLVIDADGHVMGAGRPVGPVHRPGVLRRAPDLRPRVPRDDRGAGPSHVALLRVRAVPRRRDAALERAARLGAGPLVRRGLPGRRHGHRGHRRDGPLPVTGPLCRVGRRPRRARRVGHLPGLQPVAARLLRLRPRAARRRRPDRPPGP